MAYLETIAYVISIGGIIVSLGALVASIIFWNIL